jgi:hypothetical protein
LSYDYVGDFINFGASSRAGQFFLETWGEDIIQMHDTLERYFAFRGQSDQGAYKEFSWLAEEAKLVHRDPPPADVEHPARTIIRYLKT